MCLARLFRLMDLRTRYTPVFSALASAMTSLPCDQLLNLIMAIAGYEDTKKWPGILKFSRNFCLLRVNRMKRFSCRNGVRA